MPQIQLALYSVRVKRHHGRSSEITSNFGLERDVFDFLSYHLGDLKKSVSRHDSERQVMRVTKLKSTGRDLEGIIETGHYGIDSTIWDVQRGTVAFSKTKTHAEFLPFYFLFRIPEAKDQGLLLLQRTGILGIRKILEVFLAAKFKSEFEDYRLSFNPLIPEEVLKKYTGPNAELKELIFVRHGIGSDVTDALGATAKARGRMKLSITASEAGAFSIKEQLASFFRGDRELQNLVEFNDETRFLYDNVKMVVVVDGKEKTVNLANPKQFRAAYDASGVKLDASGHPRFEQMSAEAMSIMTQAQKQVWGGTV